MASVALIPDDLATVDSNPDVTGDVVDSGGPDTFSQISDFIAGMAKTGVETWGAVTGTKLTPQAGVAIPQQSSVVGTVTANKQTIALFAVGIVAIIAIYLVVK